ncbi:hypothetical protein AB8U03_13615 [Clostridium sp. Mt-5]|uniref:Uncharacterized protein n=1 Tax=Clostridium moutaii TaxID=3240932 RepID=A0ABV4BR06_9CLOT
MAYVKTIWKNRIVERPRTYQFQQNADGTVTTTPQEGAITETGTPVNAVNMNHIEDGIVAVNTENSIYVAGGSANAITVTTPNGDYTYTQFKRLSIKAAADNTGNVTINVDNQGAVPVLKYDSSQLPAGAIKTGKVYDFYYDTTNNCFFLIAKASGDATAADVLAGKKCSTDFGDIVGTMDLKAENIKEGITYAGIIGILIPAILLAGDDIILYQNANQVSSISSIPQAVGAKITTNITGTVRITFTIFSEQSVASGYGQIYKNGSPIGTLKNSANLLTYTQDFSCNKGDIFQLYLYCTAAGWHAYSNLFKVSILKDTGMISIS